MKNINYKIGFHRVFIFLSVIFFVYILNSFQSSIAEYVAFSLFSAVAFYSIYWVIIWIISGFRKCDEVLSMKGYVIALIFLIFICVVFLITQQVNIENLKKQNEIIKSDFASYRSRIEGNYTGWTLEEIQKLFNGQK